MLCERFTTSKLQEFEDLQSINTYGFRGEALASISHIAHLSVTTRTAASSCAWKAHYSDGKLAPPKPGQSVEPKATAGKIGTQITVEDLFYNIPSRKRAFRSPSEEYAKIIDLVGRYAVHREGISFSCRKHGDPSAGISVPAAASATDRIRQIHGNGAASELVKLEASDAEYHYTLSGLASTVNYHAKRISFLLFINHRSVESTPIRKAIDQVYQHFLPKGQHPFVYIDLRIDPKCVDVNVHPTKREVRFLHEEEIIEQISDAVRAKLSSEDATRTFMTQSLLRQTSSAGERALTTSAAQGSDELPSTAQTKTPAKIYENNLVRTDPRSRKITSMLQPQPTSLSDPADPSSTSINPAPPETTYDHEPRQPTNCRLSSIKELRSEVRSTIHDELTTTFTSHTFVGIVDDHRRLAAIQGGVRLYLVDYGLVAKEFFYQLGLTDFGNFGTIRFRAPLDLRELLQSAAQLEADLAERSGSVQDVAFDWSQAVEQVLKRLVQRREMLAEYFNLLVSEDGKLEAIPLLLRDYKPCLAKLPRFLLRLGPYVDWTGEKECFCTFLEELALFYTPEPLPLPVPVQDDGDRVAEGTRARTKARRAELAWSVEHVLFPAFKARLVATRGMLKYVVEVANLKGLYRVFERC